MADYYIIVNSTCVIKNYKYTEQPNCLLNNDDDDARSPQECKCLAGVLPSSQLPALALAACTLDRHHHHRALCDPTERVSGPANSALQVP